MQCVAAGTGASAGAVLPQGSSMPSEARASSSCVVGAVFVAPILTSPSLAVRAGIPASGGRKEEGKAVLARTHGPPIPKLRVSGARGLLGEENADVGLDP